MNKYQESLDRIKTIDLDIIEDLQTRYEQSHYGIHDYPTLEMSGDIKKLQELVDKETPMNAVEQWEDLNSCEKYYKCPKCKLIVSRMCLYCPFCGQKLDWSDTDA